MRLKKIPHASSPLRFDVEHIDDKFCINIKNSFEILLNQVEESPSDWIEARDAMREAAKQTIPTKKNKINHWISDETLSKVKEKRNLTLRV